MKRISVGGLATKTRRVQVLVRHGFTLLLVLILATEGTEKEKDIGASWEREIRRSGDQEIRMWSLTPLDIAKDFFGHGLTRIVESIVEVVA